MLLKFLILIITFFSFNNVFSYEIEGFDSFTEEYGNISFVCKKQCFLSLGEKQKNNYIKIFGNLIGTGKVSYGFFNGKEIVPAEYYLLNDNTSIKYKFSFNSWAYYSQIPDNMTVVIYFDGNIEAKNLSVILGKSTFLENLSIGWSDFLKNEGLTPYSINLRYGVQILGISIIKYGYILFLLLFSVLVFTKKYNNLDTFLIVGFSIFLLIGFRNLITYTDITKIGLNTFTNSSVEEKKFFDLGDYIVFTDKIIKKIDTSSCTVYIDSFQNWPFKTHLTNVYLKHCITLPDIADVDYAVFYKKDYDKNIDGEVLVDFNNSYLIKINK